ncbi:uncharacterized protein MAM_06962 [Metarhizium album ARSEF 1941]|uniref:Uncharacterized protein n=1 Tax=Metarhizium album (strain ARSEF 1941) TaxID=1081103 RepID=A0A0B2WGZ7_METAS|nr:uncharacterized protein MAM_06962 [Metarhizium album ARSEF 1941]KHN95251.1 hypothetical protein MAM_06962 [Metarhizium album ARSEF 1941]
MADAERERLELNARIEKLEMDKRGLEAENESTINQNRDLLEQLEALNSTLSDSDVKIKSLESTLLSSQQSVRLLESSAGRAADFERHIAILEDEQEKLLNELRSSKEDARSHSQRFKEAQRGILNMQDQLDRIEEEARQERQRHAQVIERMERQREIEKQLDTAAGRLKGAAATKSLQEQKNSSKIVGHFVKDLLQDNANLQLGMAELREMLINSNDEIQSLRDQLMHHQPMAPDSSRASTLRAELETLLEPPSVSQELHIHHHYHVSQKHETRKLKKKRQGLFPGVFTPPAASAPSSPRISGNWGGLTSSPTAPALLSRVPDSDTSPTVSKPAQVWDGHSRPASEISSSLPSSPQLQQNRVFDSTFTDSDPPNSPTSSFDPMSPTWRAAHSKRPSLSSTVSFQSLAMSLMDSVPDTPPCGPVTYPHCPKETIEEEDEEESKLPPLKMPTRTPALTLEAATPTEDSSLAEEADFCPDEMMPRPRLHRASSHESIMSLSGGLDIHTLKSRPSQMTLRPLGGVEAVVTGVIARPTLSKSTTKRSDAALRDHFAGFQTSRSASSPNAARLSYSPATPQGKLGKWVGWRPWAGSSPSPNSSPVLQPENLGNADKDKDKELHRSPGINQPGAIPGFQQYWSLQKRKGAPAQVTATTVDREALIEVLQE